MTDHRKEGESILRQAIADANRKKIAKLWHDHKKQIFAILIVVALACVTFGGYNLYKKDQEEKYSVYLQQAAIASESGDFDAAKKIVEKVYKDQNSPKNIRALASLKYASILLKEEKIDEAVKIYSDIASGRGYDSFIKDLSGLEAIKAMVDSGNKKYDDQIIKLSGSLENSKNLKYFVLEQKAIFEWDRGNYKIANEIFTKLANDKDEAITQAIKSRAKDMVGIYNSKHASVAEIKQSKIENKK